ncbi:MAG: PIN domain-containing protein [Betaproteobacteria bacterium]
MTAADTSVVVAAFAAWHEGHAVSVAALARRPRLPAHVALESYSVLTRLPAPHTAAPVAVVEFLRLRFAAAPLTLPARAYTVLLREMSSAAIFGGRIYDALIAETAKRAGALLLTRDRRALPTYEHLGVRFELIGG